MIVEDSPSQRGVLVEFCRSAFEGEILTADDGEDALRQLAGLDQLHLLITDLQMPVIDGVALLRRVAELGLSPRVILISGEHASILAAAERVAKAYGMPLLGSLEKPMSRAAFETVLGRPVEPMRQAPRRSDQPSAPISCDDVRSWVDGGQLSIVLQPKVDLATGAVSGAEALSRLRDPGTGQVVSPGVFIPLIEQDTELATHFTLAVTRCVAREVGGCSRLADLPTVSINLPSTTLHDHRLADRLIETVLADRLDPSRVIWEVTETAALENLASATEILTRLRLKGCGLSIDDYGTGHSSLERLSSIPFTEVKIDRALVHGCASSRSAQKIISSTVRLSHDLEMNCVAEGAECDEEISVLRALGCDHAQGFAIARPMSAPDFLDWSRNAPRTAGPDGPAG